MLEFIVIMWLQSHSPSTQMQLALPTPHYVQTEDDCLEYADRVGKMYVQNGQAVYVISLECQITERRRS